jgi:hypothetical protein|tara:strand:+ start:1552 stop:1788 length:237 start_codon:yes stop_codon:yes gene_type:complete
MGLKPKKGSLVRWVNHYDTYAAYPEGLVGLYPKYKYGIVMEISSGSAAQSTLVVFCYDCLDMKWRILDINYDDYEILT